MSRLCSYFCGLSIVGILCVYFEGRYAGYFGLEIINETVSSKLDPFSSKKFSSSSHCLIFDVVRPDAPNVDQKRITLAIHGSADRIGDLLTDQINNWNGPVSLAVVVDPEYFDLKLLPCLYSILQYLKKHSETAAKHLSAHLLIQNYSSRCGLLKAKFGSNSLEPCPDYRKIWKYYRKQMQDLPLTSKIRKMTSYAVNEARNLAKNTVKTTWFVPADMDHFFSQKFEQKMRLFAENFFPENRKTVLVYRIFEAYTDRLNPLTKNRLKMLLEKGAAREFHVKNGSEPFIEKLDEWLDSRNDTSVQFVKSYNDSTWEPQFVGVVDEIPDFDARFRYPMRDNTVLRWTMCRQNFTFAVLNNVFMYHRGFKDFSEQNILNYARKLIYTSTVSALTKFNEEMDSLYPETRNTCPSISL